MGCDIHLHIEVKLRDDDSGAWHHYAAPDIDRWYELFGVMAGVRTDEYDPISLPRGLPDDMTRITAVSYERWRDDAHHASWLGMGEIARLSEWYDKHTRRRHISLDHDVLKCYLFDESFGRGQCHEASDVRFVFWFDN